MTVQVLSSVFALFISQMIEQIHENETERQSSMHRPTRRVSLSEFLVGIVRDSNSAFADVYDTQDTVAIDNPLRPDASAEIALTGNIEMKTKRVSDISASSETSIEEKYIIAVRSLIESLIH